MRRVIALAFLLVSNNTFAQQPANCDFNRSDQTIRHVDVAVGGGGVITSIVLAPGQETELASCGSNGSGGSPNAPNFLIYVDRVRLDRCFYQPSQSLPKLPAASARALATDAALQPANIACEFKLNEPSVKQAAISGADGVHVPVHVMHQPDSPLEILSVDLTNYTFNAQRGADGIYRYSYRSRCTVKVRNRSNVPIRGFEVAVGSNGLLWTQPGTDTLGPGEEMELEPCGGGGSGHGPHPPQLVISIERVELGGCAYQPSRSQPSRCDFRISEPSTRATTLTGTDGIRANLHVVPQPDSPLEILAVDFTGSHLDVSRSEEGSYRFTSRIRCKIRVRNRSNQAIHRADLVANAGALWRGTTALAPGQEVEVTNCRNNASGGIQGEPTVLIFVERVDFESCSYRPSMRLPYITRSN